MTDGDRRRAQPKTAAKTPAKMATRATPKPKTTGRTTARPTLVPQPHGGALLSGGTPGNAGGTGRPPHAFVARMRELAGSDERCEQLEAVLSDPAHPHWLAALRFVSAYGYGKPHATLEVDAVVSASTTPKAVWRFGDREIVF